MKRLITYPAIFLLSIVLSIVQFFLTGIYGKIVLIPIFLFILTHYETKNYYKKLIQEKIKLISYLKELQK